jgi:hypothetical protein
MKNIDLNAGGILGAVLCIAVALGAVFLIDLEDKGRFGKVVVIAAIGGSVGGNFLWDQIQKSRHDRR